MRLDTHPDRVSNEPLRKAFLRSGEKAGVVAQRMGIEGPWSDQEVKRLLGLRNTGRSPRGTNGYAVKTLAYDTALRIAEALDVDPVDVGL